MNNKLKKPFLALRSPRLLKAGVVGFFNISSRRMWFYLHVLLAGAVLTAGGSEAAAREPAPMNPDEALARQAYQLAENWVRRAEVPDASPVIGMTNVAAVQVTLRRSGVMLGRAIVPAEEGEAAKPAEATGGGSGNEKENESESESAEADQTPKVDVMSMVRPAVRRALREAAGTMRRSRDLPEVAPEITLDLQLARTPEPIEIDRLRDLPTRLTVSRDGLAMRRADRWAWMFPGTAIATNASLQSQINRLLGDLDLPPHQLEAVGQPGGPPLYRFKVIHLVRPRIEGSVRRLHRGQVTLSPNALDEAALEDLARQLAGHLMRQQRSDGRFAGAYEPTADRHKPTTAGPSEAARAAFALARRARLPGLSAAPRRAAREAAAKAVDALLARLESDAPRPIAELGPKAMLLLALLETPSPGGRFGPERRRLASDLRRMQQPDGSFRDSTRENARPASIAHQAAAAAALARLFDYSREPKLLQRTRRALDALWSGMNERRFIQSLPWLAYAHATLARLGRNDPHRDPWIKQSRTLWQRQVMPWSRGENREPSPDTIGGFLLGGTILHEPTARSAEALASQAVLLRTDELVNTDARPTWLYRSGLAARFLSQLTLSPSGAYYVRNRPEAVGGLRLSLVNNRQPLEATAAALLAITELRHALAGLRDRPHSDPPPATPQSPAPPQTGEARP